MARRVQKKTKAKRVTKRKRVRKQKGGLSPWMLNIEKQVPIIVDKAFDAFVKAYEKK
jgi:hypothetical protein